MMSNYKNLEDGKFVELLLEDDNDAWVYLYLNVSKSVSGFRRYREMLERTCHNAEEVAGQLYEDLHKNDFAILRSFAADGQSFKGWLSWRVLSAVERITGLTGSKDRIQPNDRELSCDPDDSTSPIGMAKQDISSIEVHIKIMDSRENFVRLWQDDPEGAYALLMKDELGLPSKLVGSLLGRPFNTVDQKVKRARAKLARLDAP